MSNASDRSASTDHDDKQHNGSSLFRISLAQWSLHQEHFNGSLDNLDFPTITRERYGLEACEFVNQFFKDRAEDAAYLSDLRSRADDAGVRCLLIMCDGEGNLGDPDDTARSRAVQNHVKWLDAANALGCHSHPRQRRERGHVRRTADASRPTGSAVSPSWETSAG
jgi:hypothetical protein